MVGGGAWPVVQRELRAEARNGANYWTRVYTGLLFVLMFAGVMLLVDHRSSGQSLGSVLFGNLQAILVTLIWLGTPLLTADCIARERREGTLGLLFLTPLSPLGIVLGKSAMHLLRSFSLLLVAVPVLLLPVILGGVAWNDAVLALLIDLSSLLLAFSAGLLASTLSENWARAVVLSELLGFSFLAGFVATCGNDFLSQAMQFLPFRVGLNLSAGEWFLAVMGCGVLAVSDAAGIWREAWMRFPPTLQDGLVMAAARNFLLFGVVAATAVGLAAWRLRSLRTAQAHGPNIVRTGRWYAHGRCVSVFFRRRRVLDRNPIAWLQSYSPGARLSKWGWCAVVLLLVSLPFAGPAFALEPLMREDRLEWQLGVFVLVAAGMAFCAASSFRQEKETGAIELILVTPLRVREIVAGRLQGIWSQFLPAAIVLSLSIALSGEDVQSADGGVPFLFVVASTFLTLPVLGMLLSTVGGSWIACWVATFLLGMTSPLAPEACFWCLATALDVARSSQFSLDNETVRALNEFWNLTPQRQFFRNMLLPFMSQWLIAGAAATVLFWRLKRRLYGQA